MNQQYIVSWCYLLFFSTDHLHKCYLKSLWRSNYYNRIGLGRRTHRATVFHTSITFALISLCPYSKRLNGVRNRKIHIKRQILYVDNFQLTSETLAFTAPHDSKKYNVNSVQPFSVTCWSLKYSNEWFVHTTFKLPDKLNSLRDADRNVRFPFL